MTQLDNTRDVRAGEELDLAALAAHLASHAPALAGELTVTQFPGGHSNLTYLLNIAGTDVVLRRPPFGPTIKSAHDMGREFRILSGLFGHYQQIPKPLLFCDDESVLGRPFYLMERLRGVILRKATGPGLTPEVMAGLSRAFVDNLVAIHNVDVAQAGLETLGRPDGYVQRQISGWTTRYQKSKTDDIPQIDEIAVWLEANRPAESGATLIHNDYKYDNIVLDPGDLRRIIGVLDWEMATLGDPLMDLGTSLSLWIDPDDPVAFKQLPFGPTSLPGNLNRQQIVERYAEQTGRNLSNSLYYFVYGLFKMAVVLQQIYKRFKTGHSTDPRFAMMIVGVHTFAKVATLALERDRIDQLG